MEIPCVKAASRMIRLASTALLVAAATGLAGCSDGDSGDGAGATVDPQPPAEVTTTSETPAETAPDDAEAGALSGTFTSASELEGYTVDMSYDIAGIELEVDIANAKPGEASMVPRATGGAFTVTNTTEGRNTEIVLARPTVGLMWRAAGLPSEIRPLLRGDCDVEFRGKRYCTLARVTFESTPEGHVLEPDGEISLAIEPAPSDAQPIVRRIFGVYEIAEEQAEPLASFVQSTPPELVWVNSDITQGHPSPTWSCATQAGSQAGMTAGAAAGYLAILDGDGEALVDGGGIRSYEGEPRQLCSAA